MQGCSLKAYKDESLLRKSHCKKVVGNCKTAAVRFFISKIDFETSIRLSKALTEDISWSLTKHIFVVKYFSHLLLNNLEYCFKN